MSTTAIERVHQLHGLTRRHSRRIASTRLSLPARGSNDVPLLMLNGVGAPYSLWDELRQHIERPTVAFDVQSTHLGGRPSIRTFVQFVRNMLDEHRIDEVDVLGLSWGGFAAQQLVHDYPTRVRRLVLASTSPGYYSIPARPASYLELLRPSRSHARAAALSKHLYAGDFLADPSLIHRLGLLRPIDAATYRRQMWATIGWSSLPWLHRIRHQTLILHGDDDPIIPFVNAQLMQKLLPNATLDRVEQGGHLYLYTRPSFHGSQITSFLSEPNVQPQ